MINEWVEFCAYTGTVSYTASKDVYKRQLMPHLGMLVDAPLRFQTAVHSLDVLLRDKGDLFIAQLWFDVVFDVPPSENGGAHPRASRAGASAL